MAASFPDPQQPRGQEFEPQPEVAVGETWQASCRLRPYTAPDLFPAPAIRPELTVMRQQVIDLILDIISATDPQSEVRLRLLRHLAAHPGCPEQALLCHLVENSQRPSQHAVSRIEAK
jgi:hypothetical protein